MIIVISLPQKGPSKTDQSNKYRPCIAQHTSFTIEVQRGFIETSMQRIWYNRYCCWHIGRPLMIIKKTVVF